MIDGLAMVVRADCGGLGVQSYELWRHLQPEHTIVMRLPDPRGHEHLGLYPDATLTEPGWRDAALKVAKKARLLLTIEGTYGYTGHTKVAVVANPELWAPEGPVDRAAVHTTWEQDRIRPRPAVLPYPCPTDAIAPRDVAPGWYHPAAPAMLDRNGTDVVLAAARLCKVPHDVYVRSDDGKPWGGRATSNRVGRCTVHWLQGRTPDYRDAYPQECGAMVLPRRYGGNCLPMYEAACMGWPVVAPDLIPQASWPFVQPTNPGKARKRPMKGGPVAVWEPSPHAIARAMDDLAVDPAAWSLLRMHALTWARSRAWPQIAGAWVDWLA